MAQFNVNMPESKYLDQIQNNYESNIELISKFNNKDQYPLGIQLPKIIKLMRKKGEIE